YVGGATVNITPEPPVALDGMRARRIAKEVAAPCTASALVLETREGDRSVEQVIFVSCDLIAIRGGDDFYASVREQIQGRVPDTALNRLVINATHTHWAPVLMDGKYDLDKFQGQVLQPADYRKFLFKQLGDAIAAAWEKRVPARIAWGLGHADVAQNRRAVYADGSAVMYGKTNQPSFRGIEGYEDHGVEVLYFWDQSDKLIATCINVAAPSQGAGGGKVHADFWHHVREPLREKYGADLTVLAWCGAAGDQEVRSMYRQAAENRMEKLRGLNRIQELARRIIVAWEDVLSVVEKERHSDIALEHRSKMIQLPERKITEAEVAEARKEVAKWEQKPDDPSAPWNRNWHQGVVNRYEQQQQAPQFREMLLQAVRIGDVAIVTNDFELYTDYGVQMKARSPALQTFVVQLCGSGSYLPTPRAVAGGGYSAVPQSTKVGPEGGQVLVEESVELIKSLWQPASTSGKTP
ncbi:MAG TPA: hypothetical protein VNQ76_03240, partial [Planctomicrobium sp.]|nr:hypothetical protein [Planctomicrobium sp.]